MDNRESEQTRKKESTYTIGETISQFPRFGNTNKNETIQQLKWRKMLGTFWAHAGIGKNGAYFFAFLALPIVDWKADESSFCPWHSASQESDDRAEMSDFDRWLLQGRSIYPFDSNALFRKRLFKNEVKFSFK